MEENIIMDKNMIVIRDPKTFYFNFIGQNMLMRI